MRQRKITKALSLEGSVDGWSHFMPLEEGKAVKHKNVPPVRSICRKSAEKKTPFSKRRFSYDFQIFCIFSPCRVQYQNSVP